MPTYSVTVDIRITGEGQNESVRGEGQLEADWLPRADDKEIIEIIRAAIADDFRDRECHQIDLFNLVVTDVALPRRVH